MLIIFKHCHTDSKEVTKQYFVAPLLMMFFSLSSKDFYYDNWSILYPLFPSLTWNGTSGLLHTRHGSLSR